MDELSFFQGRKVLVTGHTGFKGAWLTLWLLERGADVAGYSLAPPSEPSLFEVLGLGADIQHNTGDIRDLARLQKTMDREQPEVVFHLAAQPIVRQSYRQPRDTFDVNVLGTVNVLEAMRRTESVRVAVLATSDKCYENRGAVWGLRENDPLGGCDPYSASKACAELVAHAYRESFFTAERALDQRLGLATVRAGNVVGGGDWAAERIVPDCLRALTAGKPVRLRQPLAIRPWQHVLEPLAGYLVLAARLSENPRAHAGAWNFGPPPQNARPVIDLVKALIRSWGAGRWREETMEKGRAMPEADYLRLCSDKALSLLPWRPQWSFTALVDRTVEWYRAFYHRQSGASLRQLCRRQIQEYERGWRRSVGLATLPAERVSA